MTRMTVILMLLSLIIILLPTCEGWKEIITTKTTRGNRVLSPSTITYRSIRLQDPIMKLEQDYLVNSRARDVMSTLNQWHDTKTMNKDQLEKWMMEGIVFKMDESLNDDIDKFERQKMEEALIENKGISSSPKTTMLYVNAGNESFPLYILARNAALFREALEKNPGEYDKIIARFEDNGLIYRTINDLMEIDGAERRIAARARKISEDRDIGSKQWKEWTEKTSHYNITSLTEVMAEYSRGYSAGDVASVEGSDYVPQRGYPGTLAPGESYQDDAPARSLPKYVVHPWPAVQEIPAHVRWPAAHPLCHPTTVWLAMNNMFREDYVQQELNKIKPGEPILGGDFMEPKHAFQIARYARFGNCYDPEIQIKHPGVEFKRGRGHNLPHYKPDHPPTMTPEECDPHLPDHVRQQVELFYQEPDQNTTYISKTTWSTLDDDTAIQAEEERRRQNAMRRMLGSNYQRVNDELEERQLSQEDLNSSISARSHLLHRGENNTAPLEIMERFFIETRAQADQTATLGSDFYAEMRERFVVQLPYAWRKFVEWQAKSVAVYTLEQLIEQHKKRTRAYDLMNFGQKRSDRTAFQVNEWGNRILNEDDDTDPLRYVFDLGTDILSNESFTPLAQAYPLPVSYVDQFSNELRAKRFWHRRVAEMSLSKDPVPLLSFDQFSSSQTGESLTSINSKHQSKQISESMAVEQKQALEAEFAEACLQNNIRREDQQAWQSIGFRIPESLAETLRLFNVSEEYIDPAILPELIESYSYSPDEDTWRREVLLAISQSIWLRLLPLVKYSLEAKQRSAGFVRTSNRLLSYAIENAKNYQEYVQSENSKARKTTRNKLEIEAKFSAAEYSIPTNVIESENLSVEPETNISQE